MVKVRRPVLRYHGGKFRLAPWIVSHFPPHRIYVEPFGGAAGVLMRKDRVDFEVYNDLDAEVVGVFRVLRDPATAEQLRRALELTPFARLEHELSYERSDDPIEQARRSIARSFLSHGSSWQKKNRTGFRGFSYRQRTSGSMDWRSWPEAVPAFVDRLRGVTIEHRDARDVIRRYDGAETLTYADPPYALSTRTSMRNESDAGRAYAHDMTDEQHVALAEVLRACAGAVVVSGYRCDLYEDLYGAWERRDMETRADCGVKRTESVWLNARAAAPQGVLF